MKPIRTIDDLYAADATNLAEVLQSISVKDIIIEQERKDSERVTMTAEQYTEYRATRTETRIPCKACDGRGYNHPYERSVGTIHASSAHRCRTKLYFDVMGDHNGISTIEPALQKTFAIGHALHEHVQGAIYRSMKDKFHEEVRVDLPEAFVSGSSADGVVDLDYTRVLLEIKSIGSEYLKLTKPKDEHIVQAMGIYATALNCPFVSIVYVQKAWPHAYKEFVLPYDPEVYNTWWATKGSHVEKAIETGEPPIPDSGKWECMDCAYAHACEYFRDPTARKTFK